MTGQPSPALEPASFIKKRTPDPDGLDFERLRKDGIDWIQALSGDVWTDYNLHDPGVTILEQLCYGLTDLAYRSGFDAADYLASPSGRIDYENLALRRPDEIFSCSPVTENDYRKLILSSVPNIDNVWLETQPDGLYRAYLQLSERVKDQSNERVRKVYTDQVRKIYAAHRNLCEDLAEVRVADRLPFALRGRIEIDGRRPQAEILAEVYAECTRYLSRKVVIRPYAEVHKRGIGLEQLFTGPLTEYGHIADEELVPWRGHFSIPELLGRIVRIEGIKRVNHLVFVDGGNRETDSISLDAGRARQVIACLELPVEDADVGVHLYRSGKSFAVSASELEAGFNRLNYEYRHALGQRRQDSDWVGAELPGGRFRDVREYSSVQHQFPDIYGLNAHGVPDSAPAERKAQAMQLKAYLLFFEQIMANFLSNAQAIPRLFSLEEALPGTYFHQVLGNDVVPGAEAVYRFDLARMDAEIGELLAGIEDKSDRRNRVLDYLLALYGEKFSQHSLHHLQAARAGDEDLRVRNKLVFLDSIVDLSGKRASAFNYLGPAEAAENGAGLSRKLRVLLGLREDEDSPWIVEHILTRPSSNPDPAGHGGAEGDFYGFRLSLLFPFGPERFAEEEFRKLAEETIRLNAPAHVYAEIHWLAPEREAEFAPLYKKWLDARRHAPAQEADAVSAEMVRFLMSLERADYG